MRRSAVGVHVPRDHQLLSVMGAELFLAVVLPLAALIALAQTSTG